MDKPTVEIMDNLINVQKPSVSITIPCRNEEEYIGKCLDSILALDYPKDRLKVYVVDGKSEDKTISIVREYSSEHEHIKLLENSKQFTPFALNIGLKADDSDVKIILGAHSEMQEDYVKLSVAILQSKPDVGCVGGIIKNVYQNKASEVIGLAMSSPFGVGDAKFRTGDFEGYVDTVAFGAYRREVFERVGFFDEDLTRNQDDEFNFRLIKEGFKIWLSKGVKSNYFVRGSYGKLFKQYYQYGYWKVFVNVKHQTVTTVRQLIPLFFVLYILALPLLGLIGKKAFAIGSLVFPIYLGGGMMFALKKTKNFLQIFSVIKVFMILHVSYGFGYLTGVKQFLIFRRLPSGKSESLSR